MSGIILRRFVSMMVVLLAMTGGTFVLMQLSPVDPVALHFVMMGVPADPQLVAEFRAELGLDQPLIVQYAHWLCGILSGDLGYSIAYGVPVADLVREALPRTLHLQVSLFCLPQWLQFRSVCLPFIGMGHGSIMLRASCHF